MDRNKWCLFVFVLQSTADARGKLLCQWRLREDVFGLYRLHSGVWRFNTWWYCTRFTYSRFFLIKSKINKFFYLYPYTQQIVYSLAWLNTNYILFFLLPRNNFCFKWKIQSFPFIHALSLSEVKTCYPWLHRSATVSSTHRNILQIRLSMRSFCRLEIWILC